MDDTKRGPGRPQKEAETVSVRVLRDYWPREEDIANGWPADIDGRVRAGTIFDIAPMLAIDGIETKMLERVK